MEAEQTPRSKSGLTWRQSETLEWIKKFIREHGMPPTVREIGDAFDIKSSSAFARLKSLEQKGYLHRGKLGARSLTIEHPKADLAFVSTQSVSTSDESPTALEPPFRQQDLLPTDAFIQCCRLRGVSTSLERLRYYEHSRLLLPAVKAPVEDHERNHGFKRYFGEQKEQFDIESTGIGFRHHEVKQDETYYHFAGILPHNSDWLHKHHEKAFAASLPDAELDVWDYYEQTDPRAQQDVRLYTKLQIFPLRHIQQSLTLQIRDRMLLAGEEAWKNMGRAIKQAYADSHETVRNRVRYYYETFALLNAVCDLIDEMFGEARDVYNKSFRMDRSKKHAMRDARMCIQHQQNASVPKKAKKLFRRFGMSVKEIIERKDQFISQGYSLDPITRWFPYLDFVPENVIGRSGGEYRLVLECYGIANQLSWFLVMLGEKPQPLENRITLGDKRRYCPFCSGLFKPRNRKQKTCGEPKCVADNKNALKRLRREVGL